MGKGTEGGLCSDFGFIGDKAKLLQSIHCANICRFKGTLKKSLLLDRNLHAFQKWRPDHLLHAAIFKRFLNIIRIKMPFSKAENKMGKQ